MDAQQQPKKHRGTVIMSVALHVAIVGMFSVGIRLPSPAVFPAAEAPIQGVIVDQSVIRKEQQRREQVAREEQQRKQRAERAERERVEQARRDKEAAEQRERAAEQQRKDQAEKERVAKEAKEKAEAVKREQERVAKEKAEQERVAKEQERVAKEKAQREEAARKQREAQVARERAQAESELQRQLAAEAEQQAAIASGLQEQWIRLIADKIERNWNRPLSAKPGLECVVNVVQIPGGDVIDARVGACNGDDAVVRSIEDAVRRAAPLPPPPTQAIFQRNIRVTFRPAS